MMKYNLRPTCALDKKDEEKRTLPMAQTHMKWICEISCRKIGQYAHIIKVPHISQIAQPQTQVQSQAGVSIIILTRIFWRIVPKSLALAEGFWGVFYPLWRPSASFLGPLAPLRGPRPLPVLPRNFSA